MELFEKRLALFPLTTEVRDGELTIAGQSLRALADEYGTPLYVYDRATLDDALGQYRSALAAYYPSESAITYAGKAFFGLAIAGWAAQSGLTLDCTGAGEIGVAAAAGAPRQQVLVHGVSKSAEDLQAAFDHAGTIVVDNPNELGRIIAMKRAAPGLPTPQVWLRLRPGVAVETHHSYTQTGQDDSKFGMGPLEFLEALRCARDAGLEVSGLHFHQGSHFHDPSPLGPALDMALDLAVEMRTAMGWTPQVICPGGGWGVPYHEDDLPHPSIEAYVRFTAEKLAAGCQARGLPLPRLHMEPGRSLVARGGVALYRVEAVKHTPHRRWLLLDGGMADNPRPALYRARYAALPVGEPQRPATGPAYLAGPFCESGDVMIEDLPLADMQPGELAAVPVSGAYHLSMGSNYNGARRPAVVWLDQNGPRLIRRRETIEDLIRRDLPL
jgi:diaminopimelate decarboxylase